MDRYVRCTESVIDKKTSAEYFTKDKKYKISPFNHYLSRNGGEDFNLFDLVLEDNFGGIHCVAQAIKKNWGTDDLFTEHFVI